MAIYVRASRYAREFLDAHDFFTVSFLPEEYRRGLSILDAKSGRDGDKMRLTRQTADINSYYEGSSKTDYEDMK